MDQPTDDGLNIFLLSKFLKNKKFKACFHGVGGDEIFGGYPSFKDIPSIKLKICTQNHKSITFKSFE